MKSLVVTCSVSLLVIVAACKSSDDTYQTGNGVDDLLVACQDRAAWPTDDANCNLCKAAVMDPHCDCSALKDFSGECVDQANAYNAACNEAIETCVANCNVNDCTCLANCYTGDAACKKAADARDGCMTAWCASYCKPANN